MKMCEKKYGKCNRKSIETAYGCVQKITYASQAHIEICAKSLEKSLETLLIRQSVYVTCYIMHGTTNKQTVTNMVALQRFDHLAVAA